MYIFTLKQLLWCSTRKSQSTSLMFDRWVTSNALSWQATTCRSTKYQRWSNCCTWLG